MLEFFCAQAGVAVGFVHDFCHVLERELPNRLPHVAQWLVGFEDVALVHRFLVVPHGTLAKQLGLAVIGIPA